MLNRTLFFTYSRLNLFQTYGIQSKKKVANNKVISQEPRMAQSRPVWAFLFTIAALVAVSIFDYNTGQYNVTPSLRHQRSRESGQCDWVLWISLFRSICIFKSLFFILVWYPAISSKSAVSASWLRLPHPSPFSLRQDLSNGSTPLLAERAAFSKIKFQIIWRPPWRVPIQSSFPAVW